MKISPTFNNVVVLRDESAGKTDGGIILPESAKGKSTRGTVIAAGPGRYQDGKLVKTTLRAGNKVVFGSYAGTEVEFGGNTYLVMADNEILATLS